MLRRLFCVVAAFVATVVLVASPASADAPEVVARSHLAGPAPALTAACGFEVTGWLRSLSCGTRTST